MFCDELRGNMFCDERRGDMFCDERRRDMFCDKRREGLFSEEGGEDMRAKKVCITIITPQTSSLYLKSPWRAACELVEWPDFEKQATNLVIDL